MADRLRIVVIGLPELGHLLEAGDPHGADVVTVPRGSDVGAVLADKARGASRDTLLFVVADTGDQAVNRLPDTLARAGFRGVVLAGLPGASGTFAPHENVRILPAPFSANDVLAALSALPGDVPFFLPVEDGDHSFPELVSASTNGRRERNGVLYPRRETLDDDPLGPPVRVQPLAPLPAPPPPPGPAPVLPPFVDAVPADSIPPAPRMVPPPPSGVTPIFATPPGAPASEGVTDVVPDPPNIEVTHATDANPPSDPLMEEPSAPVAAEPSAMELSPSAFVAVEPGGSVASGELSSGGSVAVESVLSEPASGGLSSGGSVAVEPSGPAAAEPAVSESLGAESSGSGSVESWLGRLGAAEHSGSGSVESGLSRFGAAEHSEPVGPVAAESAVGELSRSGSLGAESSGAGSVESWLGRLGAAEHSEPGVVEPGGPVAAESAVGELSRSESLVEESSGSGSVESWLGQLGVAEHSELGVAEHSELGAAELSQLGAAEHSQLGAAEHGELGVAERGGPGLVEPGLVESESVESGSVGAGSVEAVVVGQADWPPPAPVLSGSPPVGPGPVVGLGPVEAQAQPQPPAMYVVPGPQVAGGVDEPLPGWAQLPPAAAGQAAAGQVAAQGNGGDRAERAPAGPCLPCAAATSGTVPGAGALWVATPRLPAYEDEPVMPGARLPAPGRAPVQRRGDVISVCSYKGGSGKCLTGDSLIVDPVSGVPRRLDDLVRDPQTSEVFTLDGTTVRAVGIDAKIDSGVKPTVRVEFESGRSVTVTPHHPFLLGDGWRQAADIELGEVAALPARIPFPEQPFELTLLQLAQLATALSDQEDRRYGVGPDVHPRIAYRLDEDQLGQVIGLLWASDGSIGDDGTPSLELTKEAAVRTVQHLLLRYGVQSRLQREQTHNNKWRLEIPEGDRVTFAKRIALCGGQYDRLAPQIVTDDPAGHDGDIAWDRVTAITPAGDQQVWDLTVDATHCFVANDIVVHNTTTAVLAAAVLARAVQPGGKRVALVDANTAQSSVATVLQRPGRGSIVDLVRTDVDEDMLAHALTPIPEAGDLDVLFGAPDLRCADERLLTPTLWRRVVAALRRTHDYVIVDTPVAEAVGHELFDDFVLRDSSLLLVVLDPNRETIHNNVEWLDIIGDPVSAGGRNFPPDRVAIVLNRADPQLTWNEDSVGDHFRRYQFLGAIPHSMAVQQAADDARLTQRFDATVDQAVRHMLGALLHEPLLDSDAPAGANGSLLDRLLERLFGRRNARSECSPA